MSYYMGDFYAANRRGFGFPRGDPGFFSFLGNLAKSAVGFIPGVGPIASKAIDVVSHVPRPMTGAVGNVLSRGRGLAVRAGGAIVKHPALSAAGAAGALAVGAGARSLMRRGGSSLTALGRRRPHMNPCNPRALRRAIRRTHSFAKLAMRTIHLVHPKKKVRFGGFKKRKRSK